MAIFVITSDFPPYVGGIANVFSYWTKGLALSGEDILVFAPQTKNALEFDQRQSYPVIRYLPLFYPFQLFFLLVRRRPKKIIVGPVLPLGFWVFFFSFFFKFNYYLPAFGNEVVSGHDNLKDKIGFVLKRKIFQRAAKIFPCSYFTAGLVKKFGLEENKIKVIYPGVTLSLKRDEAIGERSAGVPSILVERARVSPSRFQKIILTVGRLVKRKGQHKVVAAMPLVLKKIPKAIYLIVGEGPERRNLEFRIKNLELENKVFLLDKISDQKLSYFYSLCDLFVMVSREMEEEKEVEGFGIVYLEAGVFAKPIVASKSGGIPEAVLEGKTGLLVNDPDDEKEIAQKIITLLTNPNRAKKMGNAARKRIEKELNWKKQTEKLKKELNCF